MDQQQINALIETSKKDPTLFSNINIEELLSNIDDDKYDYLIDKTTEDLSLEIVDALQPFANTLSPDTIESYCNKLIGYRVIDRICELHLGKHIRWIKKNGLSLTNGGILVNIRICDDCVLLNCKTSQYKFFNIRFEECVVFQKLSFEEQLIILSNDSV